MKNNNIGSVIVVNEFQSPIGIIIERDVVYNIAQEEATLLLQAKDVMSTPLVTIKDTNSLIYALQIMNIHHFIKLPLINNEQKLVGILTDKDI
jgi:CBS domain-containing protein